MDNNISPSNWNPREAAWSQICCRGDQQWHPQYQLEEHPSLAPELIRDSRLGDSHGQHSDISRTRAKLSEQTRGWRRYHIRTSKPVVRPDEGMSFSCFARDILTRCVKELRETTRRSPQKDSEGMHFWWRQDPPPPREITHIHQAGLLLHCGHTDAWSVHQNSNHRPTHGRL